ncbi:hypothetical protein RB195_000385 [Necator americanus]|uniref:Uncharacterized protein n=1 Tax=Necator americanus TaxID=51031 RepID=A0ABR1D9F2_NECAM
MVVDDPSLGEQRLSSSWLACLLACGPTVCVYVGDVDIGGRNRSENPTNDEEEPDDSRGNCRSSANVDDEQCCGGGAQVLPMGILTSSPLHYCILRVGKFSFLDSGLDQAWDHINIATPTHPTRQGEKKKKTFGLDVIPRRVTHPRIASYSDVDYDDSDGR